jgi:hypothetical protein
MKWSPFILVALVCASLAFSFAAVRVTAATSKIYADKDSYVESSSPAANYGGQSNLFCGHYYYSIYDAYIHFNLSSKPAGFTSAKFVFNCASVSVTQNYSVWQVNGAWSEYTITYYNRPTTATYLGYWRVTQDGKYSVDVTTLATSRSEVTFLINASDNVADDYIYISSRESSWEDEPYIEWTHPSLGPSPFVIILIIAGVAIAVIIPIAVFISNKNRKTKQLGKLVDFSRGTRRGKG